MIKKVEDKQKKSDHEIKELKKAMAKQGEELSVELSEKFEQA